MASTDPWWVEPALVVGGFVGTGLAALTAAFRKPKEQEAPVGTAAVVSASFVDKAALDQNTTEIRVANGWLARIVELMEEAAIERRDERLRRDQQERDALTAAVKALSDKGPRP